MSTTALAAEVPPADAAAIHAVIDRQTDAWNRHDMDAFVAETTPDVDWVNVVGMHWRGRDTVRRAHMALHRTMFSQSRLSPPDSVEMRQIASDVVLVVSVGRMEAAGRTPDGSAYPDTGTIMTLVFTRSDGGWRIAHAHNTTINAQAAAHDPAKAPTP